MHMNEPLLYLPQKGVDPALRVPCPLCQKPFVLAHGKAYPAENDHERFIVCSDECFIEKLPITCMWRA